jgi:polyisoprenyl-teichoic acid--peptidoglycan teichoic acid transferase
VKRVRIDRAIFLVVAIVVVVVGAGFFVAAYVRTDAISDLADDGAQISILFALELPDNRLITEVLFFDTGTNRAALFDIPSNTGVVVESLNRVDGVDTVYWNDGVELYREAVSDLLGASLDFHVAMTMAGMETTVDLLEGIPLFVADIPNEGPDAIRIPTGDVVLDGAKMQSYVAYSSPNERERERIARSQKAIAGMVDRFGEKSNLVADPVGLGILFDAVQTNIDRRAFVSLAAILGSLEVDRIITRQVEGTMRQVETGGETGAELGAEAGAEAGAGVSDETEQLLFPHQEGRWLAESVRQVVENLQSQEALRDENLVIRLEILNGTGNTGLARRTAELYRSYGFDVVTVGNAASEEVAETIVVDRVGNEIFTNRTAEIIRASLVDLQLESQAGVDVTIILGEDFDGRYVR